MSWLAHLWHWIEVHTGTVNESGPYYGFWSGFGSDIGEITLVGAVLATYKHHNCGVRWCPWIGVHAVEGTLHKTCRIHSTLAKHRELHRLHAIEHPEQHALLNRGETKMLLAGISEPFAIIIAGVLGGAFAGIGVWIEQKNRHADKVDSETLAKTSAQVEDNRVVLESWRNLFQANTTAMTAQAEQIETLRQRAEKCAEENLELKRALNELQIRLDTLESRSE